MAAVVMKAPKITAGSATNSFTSPSILRPSQIANTVHNVNLSLTRRGLVNTSTRKQTSPVIKEIIGIPSDTNLFGCVFRSSQMREMHESAERESAAKSSK